MQLFYAIVRGQPDCECKEGCKGDPYKKCDCDLDTPPANETQADQAGKHQQFKPLLVPILQNIHTLLKKSILHPTSSCYHCVVFPLHFIRKQAQKLVQVDALEILSNTL